MEAVTKLAPTSLDPSSVHVFQGFSWEVTTERVLILTNAWNRNLVIAEMACVRTPLVVTSVPARLATNCFPIKGLV